ncbi:hypothetical protein ABZS88_27610 [Streptomyces sp. NPDC005480]|uniref:hypothetical protein n=1 Tax=Streptomyces sp. NPDC005480 TaxID=3154880 RepID=UPI0033ADAFA1
MTPAAVFAAVFAVLFASHVWADHCWQTNKWAEAKAAPSVGPVVRPLLSGGAL